MSYEHYERNGYKFVFDSEKSYLKARIEYLDIPDTSISFCGFLVLRNFKDLSIQLESISCDTYITYTDNIDYNYNTSNFTLNYHHYCENLNELLNNHYYRNLNELFNTNNSSSFDISYPCYYNNEEEKEEINKNNVNKEDTKKNKNERPFNRFEHLDLR